MFMGIISKVVTYIPRTQRCRRSNQDWNITMYVSVWVENRNRHRNQGTVEAHTESKYGVIISARHKGNDGIISQADDTLTSLWNYLRFPTPQLFISVQSDQSAPGAPVSGSDGVCCHRSKTTYKR